MIENQEIVNPVAMMQTLNNNKDWDKFVGSVWGELEVFENLTFKTSLRIWLLGRKELVPC